MHDPRLQTFTLHGAAGEADALSRAPDVTIELLHGTLSRPDGSPWPTGSRLTVNPLEARRLVVAGTARIVD